MVCLPRNRHKKAPKTNVLRLKLTVSKNNNMGTTWEMKRYYFYCIITTYEIEH